MSLSSSGVQGISLQLLVPEATGPAAKIAVEGCSSDSRRCRPGDVYIALSGTVADGHDFAHDAVARGAVAVVAERPIPDLHVPVTVVSDARSAYGHICQSLAGAPSERVKVIGITGTNGKTTTAYLTVGVLDAMGYASGLLGTLGRFDGLSWEPSAHTTPPPAVLARSLARMEMNGCTHAVMEVSSHGLAQRRLAGVTLDMAAVTNVRHDHVDYHKTLSAYRASKLAILDYLSPDGLLITNADDQYSQAIQSRWKGPALTVGIENGVAISATPLECHLSEQTFLLQVGSDTVPVRTPLIGTHNIYNCLFAATIGLGCGADTARVVRGIESVAKVPGRLERIECGQPFGVFVDYAHTADALAECLDGLRPLVSGRLICVFGAGGDRDNSKRRPMGQAVSLRADAAIVTSDNPRSEDPGAIAQQVLAGFENRRRVRVELDRTVAIHTALAAAKPGDCVIVAGKGHENYQIVGPQRYDFDDREVVREWLYDHVAGSEQDRS